MRIDDERLEPLGIDVDDRWADVDDRVNSIDDPIEGVPVEPASPDAPTPTGADDMTPIGPAHIDGTTPITDTTSPTLDTEAAIEPDIAAVAMPEPEVVAVAMPEPEVADFATDTFQGDLSGIDQAEQQLDQLGDFDG